MEMHERNIARDLRSIADQVDEHLTPRDALFLYKQTQQIIQVLIDAEEPMNSTQRYRSIAEQMVDHLQSFVNYRECENWCEQSTHSYQTLSLSLIQSKRALQSSTPVMLN